MKTIARDYETPRSESIEALTECAVLGASEVGRLEEVPHPDFDEPFN